MTQTATLRSFLMPFPSGQILLPHSSMVEVLSSYTMPLKIEDAPAWMAGILLWRSTDVPLVNLEWLVNGTESEPGASSPIVIINTLGGLPQFPYLGLLAVGAPHVLVLGREDLGVDDTRPLTTGLKSRVWVRSQSAIILDLNALEEILLPLVQQYA